MFSYLIFGAVYAFAAAVQPGPFLAYLISQALSAGWRRTLPAALSPLVSDGPVIVIVVFVLDRLPPATLDGLRLAGGVLVLALAGRAFRTWRAARDAPAEIAPSTRRSVLSAALVNIANPGPWLGWSLVMGPLLLKGWREAPSHGVALVAGFYATMTASLAGIIVLFGAARSLGTRVSRALLAASAVGLALFGCWQVWAGASALIRG